MTALRELSKLAQTGHANAQFNLVILDLTGNGVERDVARSVELHRKAADQKLPTAQHGIGVKQDYAEALNWFKRAASQGFAVSEFNIGVMYFNDRSVKRNDFEIVKWISLAAARKFAPAEFRLGQMYEKGVIFGKNEREALHWYRLAEAHGDKNGPAARARAAKALNITGPLAAGPVPAAFITGFKPVR